jgi:transcriptional regulator with XRE-family HTH domain
LLTATIRSVERDSDLVTLGRGIRACRRRRGLSQEELAEQADLSRNYVGLLERGERNASATALINIARALRVSPAEFWPSF